MDVSDQTTGQAKNQPPVARILVVEDDVKLSSQIERFLVRYQYQVEIQNNGLAAIDQILETQPDVVILDLMLPGADGFDICRSVRAHYRGSILMLTASEDDMDHVAGLELGADDFLIKPIHPRVLLAHIKLLLRKQLTVSPVVGKAEVTAAADSEPASRNAPIVFGALTLHPLQRVVSLDGDDVSLTPAEFDVLHLLVGRAEEVVSREEMLRQLRGIEYDGLDRSVDVKVSALRRKLGDNLSQPRKIITVRAKGYLFVPDAW